MIELKAIFHEEHGNTAREMFFAMTEDWPVVMTVKTESDEKQTVTMPAHMNTGCQFCPGARANLNTYQGRHRADKRNT